MFTGIVQAKVQVLQAELVADSGVAGSRVASGDAAKNAATFLRLTVQAGTGRLAQLQRGASIAVNGTCLTATEFDSDAGWVRFDVIDETLHKTNLGTLNAGSWVNFERSLKFGDEIGGHLVSGHVQATARIADIIRTPDNCAMQLEFPPELAPYIQPKGFIAVDGASLTVGAVDGNRFWLHLIPETLEVTTLGLRQPGDALNLELDAQTVTIVQTVERLLQARGLGGQL
jgi:riboflavin synthase